MRISSFLPTLLLATLLLPGCTETEPAAPSLAVVDTARVFRDSEPGKAGVKFLEAMHEKMQAELNALQDTLQKNPEDQAAQQKLQETYMSFQQRMGAEQQNVITLLNDATQRTLDAYRERKNLDMIFSSEGTLSWSRTADVTNEIIAELNKQKVEFKPITPEPAKAAPAPEQAKPEAKAAPAPQKPDAKAAPAAEHKGAKAAPKDGKPKDAKAAQ